MKHLTILSYAWMIAILRKPFVVFDSTLKILYLPGFNKLRQFNGIAKTYFEFYKAKKSIPAYKKFLKSQGFSNPSFSGMIPNLAEIPIVDKENYVKIYNIESRCIDGKIPSKGVVIDESSGSSGKATNWIRGEKERLRNARMIRFGLKNLIGNEPIFIINGFALGPWATGVNISMSCVSASKLKSIGPDKVKIENTIKQFGKNHKYVIMGYPPFLKTLVDESEIDWTDYNISFIFGGESMSEGMRDYLYNKGIKKIYSSFGASDLELNIAIENDFTISLRKLLLENELLRSKIIDYTGAIPMVFQYNPAEFFIETTVEGELIITVCRPDYIAPKIRYNIHDKGQILQIKKLKSVLKELKINENVLEKPKTDLPILLHFGRADMTVSFFGSNISPNEIQETICNLPEFLKVVNTFCISIKEDFDSNIQLIVSIEIQNNKNFNHLKSIQNQNLFFDQLSKINQDFREAKRMITSNNQLIINFFEFGEGFFKENDIRIKSKYLC